MLVIAWQQASPGRGIRCFVRTSPACLIARHDCRLSHRPPPFRPSPTKGSFLTKVRHAAQMSPGGPGHGRKQRTATDALAIPATSAPGPQHAACVAQLSEQIRRQHARKVERLRRILFDTTPLAEAVARGTAPGLRVPSVTDPHAHLTVVATISELDEPHAVPTGAGSLVRVSIAGQHRVLDRRVSVDPAEAEAWARLVLGPWAAHGYRSVEAVTAINGQAGASFYLVFLDADGNPVPPPENDDWPVRLLPLNHDGPVPDC